MVVMWSIAAIAVFVICLGHRVHMAKYLRKADLDNVIPACGSLYKEWSMSVLECCRRCEKVTGFKSLFYVQNTHACECHGTTYAAGVGLSVVPSARYYEKQEISLKIYDDDVTPMFSCPADAHIFRQVVLSDGSKFKYRAFVEITRSFDDAVAKCVEEGAKMFEVLTLEKFSFNSELMACPGATTKPMDDVKIILYLRQSD